MILLTCSILQQFQIPDRCHAVSHREITCWSDEGQIVWNAGMDYTARNFTDLHKMSRISRFSRISGPNLNLTLEMTKMKYYRLKGLEACMISLT